MQKTILLNSLNQIRIPENNDWIIFSILGCIFAYLFMLLSLNREASLKEFILQEIADSSNALLNWIITSVVFCIMFSAFISQYVPIIPKEITDLQVYGYQLNKFGFTFITICLYFLVKIVLTYIFYSATLNGEKWQNFFFISTKFYFVNSLVLMVLCVVHYYFPVDKALVLYFYLPAIAIVFIFKILFYFFNKNNVLPGQWFYKILYICTLQIVPVLVVWKILFL